MKNFVILKKNLRRASVIIFKNHLNKWLIGGKKLGKILILLSKW